MSGDRIFVVEEDDTNNAWAQFRCPGCGQIHMIQIDPEGVEPLWTWNNLKVLPTFSPSIRVRGTRAGAPFVCHSFVTDGMIQFLNDCTHELAGQTVPLPEWGAA
ncbi:MAG: DUF6527 family protein [Pseudomonadota bacterium]